jgi:hypothetical protein
VNINRSDEGQGDGWSMPEPHRVGDGMAVTAYETRYRHGMFMLVVLLTILGFASWAMVLFI